MTTLEHVRAIAADVLRLRPERVSRETTPEQVDGWDSLRHLQLVLALEERFGLFFEPDEVEQMTSVGEIATLVDAKLAP